MTRALVDDMPTTQPIASYLPAMLQADDFCVRFTEGLDPVLAPVLSTIDNLDAYLDPWLTPPDFLGWLAGWFGDTFVDRPGDRIVEPREIRRARA